MNSFPEEAVISFVFIYDTSILVENGPKHESYLSLYFPSMEKYNLPNITALNNVFIQRLGSIWAKKFPCNFEETSFSLLELIHPMYLQI